MAEQKITVRGGKDLGDCVEVDGVWYIRRDSFWLNGADLEDGWDVQVETGWYSNLELPATPEEVTYVNTYVAEKERKEAERMSKVYQQNNTALFIPAVGQRVVYRLMKDNKTHGVIVELSTTNNMVRVLNDGKKSPSWIPPYCLDLEGISRETAHFYDLNEVKAEQSTSEDKVQQVITEQVQARKAKLVKVNGVDCIQFEDEEKPIPLSDLAYHQEIGLYQKSQFRNW